MALRHSPEAASTKSPARSATACFASTIRPPNSTSAQTSFNPAAAPALALSTASVSHQSPCFTSCSKTPTTPAQAATGSTLHQANTQPSQPNDEGSAERNHVRLNSGFSDL